MPNELEQLRNRVNELEMLVRTLYSAAEVDPQIARTMSKVVLKPSDALVTSYDKLVNEAGASSYNVADQFDGFYESPEGKLIGYYNP